MRRWLRVVIAISAAACRGDSNGPKDAPADGFELYPDAPTAYGNAFQFAVVGDTRPANEDDVAGYPTTTIRLIWQDVEQRTPHPDFAVSTGDYVFASPARTPSTVDTQLDQYIRAREQFTAPVFAAMGNHECTGATASNCGPISSSGITANYSEFMKRILGPYGIATPYYAYLFHAQDSSWTAKLVVIAGNSWSAAQNTWLDQTLAMPTTYTFVVRHEAAAVTEAPGVSPSETLLAKYPVTLRIVGHTHTYSHATGSSEVIVGNGGAPLSGSARYGYGIVERLGTGDIQFTAFDAATNTQRDQWRVHPDGSTAP